MDPRTTLGWIQRSLQVSQASHRLSGTRDSVTERAELQLVISRPASQSELDTGPDNERVQLQNTTNERTNDGGRYQS